MFEMFKKRNKNEPPRREVTMRICANPFKTKLRRLLFLQFQGHRRCPWIHTSDICSCWTLDARGLLSGRTSTIRTDQGLKATNVNSTSGRQSLTQMHIAAYTTAARKGVEMAADCTVLLDSINWGPERKIYIYTWEETHGKNVRYDKAGIRTCIKFAWRSNRVAYASVVPQPSLELNPWHRRCAIGRLRKIETSRADDSESKRSGGKKLANYAPRVQPESNQLNSINNLKLASWTHNYQMPLRKRSPLFRRGPSSLSLNRRQTALNNKKITKNSHPCLSLIASEHHL